MNFFNLGPFELIVLGVIALVVVGPRQLPELGRMVGRWMKTLREASDEMRRGLYYDDRPSYRPPYQPPPKMVPPDSTEQTATTDQDETHSVKNVGCNTTLESLPPVKSVSDRESPQPDLSDTNQVDSSGLVTDNTQADNEESTETKQIPDENTSEETADDQEWAND